jgi:hypothetical protein
MHDYSLCPRINCKQLGHKTIAMKEGQHQQNYFPRKYIIKSGIPAKITAFLFKDVAV